MSLEFTYGNVDTPTGHALVYFVDASNNGYYASYVVLLPIMVDVTKYVPPFLMNQVGEIGPGDMSAFAFPPAPEIVEGLDLLESLAKNRKDDLIFGGNFESNDVANSMVKVNEIVEQYLEIYENFLGVTPPGSGNESNSSDADHVNDVLYSLMSESDRLGELTKLVGRLRYAIEAVEQSLIEETESDIRALGNYFPKTYQIATLLQSARRSDQKSASLADLYLKRCFHLSREEYVELGKIESDIEELIAS